MDRGKESNPAVGSFSILNPPEPKKRKLDKSKCIICQNTREHEPLRKAKDSSVQKLAMSARQRQDEVLEQLIDIPDGEIYWHLVCYASYTSAHNIQHAAATNESKRFETDIKISVTEEGKEGGRLFH